MANKVLLWSLIVASACPVWPRKSVHYTPRHMRQVHASVPPVTKKWRETLGEIAMVKLWQRLKCPHSLSYSHLSYSFSRWRQPSYSWFCGWIQQPHFPLRSSSLDKRGLHTTSIQQLPDDLITKTMCHVQNSLHHLSFRRCLVRERL